MTEVISIWAKPQLSNTTLTHIKMYTTPFILTTLDTLSQLYDSGGRLVRNTNLNTASSQKMMQMEYKMAVSSKHREKSISSCQESLPRM